ncbi:MAG TPA: electron transfer flavoprotein subunit beta/FixA family protein [Chloroflexota bacterium]|nr:electron transfer flavoprotein subunit beta/FixA family protein [Chloroflexota bacterium]
MRIVVCVKAVPKPEEVGMNPETRTLDRSKARSEINPPDMHALEMAFALRDRVGGTVTLLSMGPPMFVPYLRLGLAMGADDAYLLSDRAFGAADTLATSYTLAKGLERIAATAGPWDVVLCGEESSDGATAQVPPGIAEWLDIPQATYVSEIAPGDGQTAPAIEVRREIKGGEERLRVPLPAVLSVAAGANVPRFFDPDRRAIAESAEVVVWDAAAVAADPALIGAAGSATTVAAVESAGRVERRHEMLSGPPEETARTLAGVIRAALSA